MRCLLLLLLVGCSNFELEEEPVRCDEPILRLHNDATYALSEPQKRERAAYPWEKQFIAGHRRITKEYFRCKGSSHNLPRKMMNRYGEEVYCADCGGVERHSLPVHDQHEYVYPVLVDVLNYLQEKTGKRVVITCGHRCPVHNTYADLLGDAVHSKHMIGAEVDFYVEGMEYRPMEVVCHIIEYYRDRPDEYSQFYRYAKRNTNVSIQPWYNKEIFLKLFTEEEGRDLDNNHPYPYLSIQVRYDSVESRWISYTWQEAFSGYMRW